jgi:hypothetical protein
MKTIQAILYIILISNLHMSAQKTFQREDSFASEFFRKTYALMVFDKYDGEIISNGDLIQYDSTALRVWTNNIEVRQIFTSGIFYPAIFYEKRIYGNSSFTRPMTKKDEAILPSPVSVLEDTIKIKIPIKDTIRLSNIEELSFLSQSPKLKRFRMWVYRGRLINPIVYFFELRNDEATETTSLSDFIKGSRLSFVQEAWVII